MIKISIDWNPVYKIIYTECTNMFKHDDMAVIVIRGSSPWSPSALPWPFSPPPNFSSIAALLVQIGSHFLSFWQQLWVACCWAVQTKSSWSFFPLDPQQSRCCLGIKESNTFLFFQYDLHFGFRWTQVWSNLSFPLSAVSPVRLPSSLGRDLNPSMIELRLLLHSGLSSSLVWSCWGLKEAFFRCAIFFDSILFPKFCLFPKPQNCGRLLGRVACFSPTAWSRTRSKK